VKKRLPLVVVAVLGVFLWRGGLGLLPVERTIVWTVPAGVEHADLQLYDGDTLLARQELKDPRVEPVMKLSLRKGTYRGLVLLTVDGGIQSRDVPVVLDEMTSVVTVP
jgi:hypothetical protein